MAIILISGFLIYTSFNMRNFNRINEQDFSDILSSWQQLYKYDNASKVFILADNEINQGEDIFYKKINPIDGIYFISKEKDPININKIKSWEIHITIKEWIYFFVLNDIFNKYFIGSENLSIEQLWKGLFLFNNISWEQKVLSYNSFLKLNLITNNNIDGSFQLFPSLFFNYNPTYNSEIKNADILRISTINNIYYVDTNKDDYFKKIFWDNNNMIEFLKITKTDFKKKITKFNTIYNNVFDEFKINNLRWDDLIKKYPYLFLNDSKKYVYLKNDLVKNIIEILNIYNQPSLQKKNNYLVNEYQEKIKNILSEMRWLWDNIYNEWLQIVKNYYYLVYFANILTKDSNILIEDKNNFTKAIKTIFSDNILWKEYFSVLSDIYFAYNFWDISEDNLDSFLNIYLWDLIKNKFLQKEDFLSFSFFLIQYLSWDITFSKNSSQIVSYLFSISNDYYNTISDTSKKLKTISFNFYNFSKIIWKINDYIINNFFIKEERWLVLKKEYSPESDKEFPKDILNWLILTHEWWTNELKNKKTDFYNFIKWEIKNNYILFETNLNKLNQIIYTINNYQTYLLKLKLNEQNRKASWLVYEDKSWQIKLSKEYVTQYLSQFNNLDIESITILNDFKKDKFYEISVKILNNTFKFKLNPKGNVVYDLVYNDYFGKPVITFKGLSISLDEKMKSLLELLKNKKSVEKKEERYDFKNIFETIYLTNFNHSDTNSEFSSEWLNLDNKMSAEMKNFVQKELLEKDFRNLDNFLIIWFKNIFAQIINWEYDITFENVFKNFNWKVRSYNTEISWKYIFKDHSFFNLILKVKREDNNYYDFNWAQIEIIPPLIFVKNTENLMENIGYYIDTLKLNYKWNSDNIKFDLNSKKIFINSESFNVNY